MNSRAYEDFTDRLYPIAKFFGWAIGILTVIFLIMAIVLEPKQFKDLRSFRLITAPFFLGLTADGTVRAIGFLFAPRSVYYSFRGQEIMAMLEVSNILLARLAMFLCACLGLGFLWMLSSMFYGMSMGH